MRTSLKVVGRERRRVRVRRAVRGTDERPRLCVFRSQKHTYAQLITDQSAKTLLAISTLSADLRTGLKKTSDVGAAKQVGLLVARRCQEQGIKRIAFDRNHGSVRAVAEGAREGGLEF